ncbi:hypothetical protein U1Q18_046402, partial [Sarracenia purpurea var. burkii]
MALKPRKASAALENSRGFGIEKKNKGWGRRLEASGRMRAKFEESTERRREDRTRERKKMRGRKSDLANRNQESVKD